LESDSKFECDDCHIRFSVTPLISKFRMLGIRCLEGAVIQLLQFLVHKEAGWINRNSPGNL